MDLENQRTRFVSKISFCTRGPLPSRYKTDKITAAARPSAIDPKLDLGPKILSPPLTVTTGGIVALPGPIVGGAVGTNRPGAVAVTFAAGREAVANTPPGAWEGLPVALALVTVAFDGSLVATAGSSVATTGCGSGTRGTRLVALRLKHTPGIVGAAAGHTVFVTLKVSTWPAGQLTMGSLHPVTCTTFKKPSSGPTAGGAAVAVGAGTAPVGRIVTAALLLAAVGASWQSVGAMKGGGLGPAGATVG